jgi:dienelactone hydrolase
MRACHLSFLLCFLAALFGPPAWAENVDVPGLTDIGHSVDSLPGWLYLPDQPQEPAVGVVYLHGCSGAIGPVRQRNIKTWANWYNDRGIALLALNSHGPRGISDGCGFPQKYDTRTQRSLDAYAGLKFLVENGYANEDRVFLHGLSQGGNAVLWALRNEPPGKYRIAGGIAFYPYCPVALYHPTAPLIILIGKRDTWTPATRCKTLIRRNPGINPGIALVSYPYAVHAFDFDFAITRNRFGHLEGSDLDAFNDSRERVGNFIEHTLSQIPQHP